jgi:hypothetical protein
MKLQPPKTRRCSSSLPLPSANGSTAVRLRPMPERARLLEEARHCGPIFWGSAAAGPRASALAPALYAAYCPDGPALSGAIRYTAAMALVACAGSFAGRRWLRWRTRFPPDWTKATAAASPNAAKAFRDRVIGAKVRASSQRHSRASGNPCRQETQVLPVLAMSSRLRGSDAAAVRDSIWNRRLPGVLLLLRARQLTAC